VKKSRKTPVAKRYPYRDDARLVLVSQPILNRSEDMKKYGDDGYIDLDSITFVEVRFSYHIVFVLCLSLPGVGEIVKSLYSLDS